MPKFLRLTQNTRQAWNPALPGGKSTTAVKRNCYPPGLAPRLPRLHSPSTRGHPSHPLDHPGRQAAAGGLQTSNFPQMHFWAGFFFFFPPRPPPGWEAEKTIPLCYGCLGLLKTLGGLRRTQEIGRCRFRSEPSGWGSSPSDGAGGAVHGGCSESPSEDCTPSPDIPDRSASIDAAPAPGTAPHNEARTCEECL